MPTNTPDQQIPLPIDADTADAPTFAAAMTAVIEPRLVLRYTNLADRSARNPAPAVGEISFLTTPGIHYRWNGAAWIELYPLVAFKATETQVVNNSTVFVNDSHLTLPVQAFASYALEANLIWDSGNTGKIKFTFTGPAGSGQNQWTITGPDSTSTTVTGIPNWLSQSGFSVLPKGAAGIGTFISGYARGDVFIAGTSGNITLQWAQNAAEAVNTRVKIASWLRLTRIG